MDFTFLFFLYFVRFVQLSNVINNINYFCKRSTFCYRIESAKYPIDFQSYWNNIVKHKTRNKTFFQWVFPLKVFTYIWAYLPSDNNSIDFIKLNQAHFIHMDLKENKVK